MSRFDELQGPLQKGLDELSKRDADLQADLEQNTERIAGIKAAAKELGLTLVEPGQRKRPARRGRRGRRKGKVSRQTQVLDYLTTHPTAKTGEVAKALGITPSHVSSLLSKSRREHRLIKDADGNHVVGENLRISGPRRNVGRSKKAKASAKRSKRASKSTASKSGRGSSRKGRAGSQE